MGCSIPGLEINVDFQAIQKETMKGNKVNLVPTRSASGGGRESHKEQCRTLIKEQDQTIPATGPSRRSHLRRAGMLRVPPNHRRPGEPVRLPEWPRHSGAGEDGQRGLLVNCSL